MKKYIFFLFVLPIALSSCSTEDAENAADEFHKRLNNGEIDYIMDNMVMFGESTESDEAAFRSALESVHAQGQHENRKKASGFNKSVRNGVTMVKLSYTFETNGQLVHERLVMADDGEGYKVLAFAMNPSEQVCIDYVAEY